MATKSNRLRVLFLAMISALVVSSGVVEAKDWALYGGIYDTRDDDGPIEAGLEFRWAPFEKWKLPERFDLVPTVGITGTEDGNAWVYGGLRLDIKTGSHWVITPQVAVALYEDGDGKDLGGVIEFRSGFEVAYRFSKGQRLGLLFYHLSNAGIYDSNPGSNSLVLTWSFGH